MKCKRFAIMFVTLSFALGVTGAAQRKQRKEAKSSAEKAANTNPDMQHEMQNATPGAAHSGLARLAGEYSTAGKFFAQPGAPPMEFGGEARLSMTLDGRFLVEEDSSNFAGQPSKSFKMVGYNYASKRYEGVWTYTMSIAIMSLNGTSADGGKTINFAASFDNEGGAKE